MRTILILLTVFVIVVGLLGFYRGWFGVSAQDEAGSATITTTVDKDKFKADKDKAVEDLRGLGNGSEDTED